MVLALEQKPQQNVKAWLENQCNQLVRQCIFELEEEEKEAWLWNSMVEMKRIISRRSR
jgi:hypothetical protein